MFYGDSFVTIDTKGRTAIPAKFREELGDKFFLMRGFDLCISVYPADRFEKLKQSFLEMKNLLMGQLNNIVNHLKTTNMDKYLIDQLKCLAKGEYYVEQSNEIA